MRTSDVTTDTHVRITLSHLLCELPAVAREVDDRAVLGRGGVGSGGGGGGGGSRSVASAIRVRVRVRARARARGVVRGRHADHARFERVRVGWKRERVAAQVRLELCGGGGRAAR